ncbi:MAG TPA: DUF6036 family nucleotidyltransferase [Thermoanaerobaculia bacterium]|nr:DUF6036 family nucleotidyltransferase [Thermoanaerobaculia bacterium]
MRRPVDAERIRRFMRELGGEAERDLRLYFTGGATAVLLGWRSSTVDVDIKVEPESDRIFRALPGVKEKLEINVELAAPDQFIPPVPGWEERSAFIAREGRLSFYHYDFYAQALSKIQRGHAKDREDVRQMLERGLIERDELRRRFEQIEPELYRYPAIDPAAFRKALENALES